MLIFGGGAKNLAVLKLTPGCAQELLLKELREPVRDLRIEPGLALYKVNILPALLYGVSFSFSPQRFLNVYFIGKVMCYVKKIMYEVYEDFFSPSPGSFAS